MPVATVYLGLGSNVDPEDNLALGIAELREAYGRLRLSPVYRSAPVGFRGEDFLNLVVELRTGDTPRDIHARIERIHDRAGRIRTDDAFIARTLDIDLLLYDDLVLTDGKIRVPRDDVLDYSFVLRPLAELAPTLRHPVTGRTMLAHWQAFDAVSHPLEPVDVIL